MGLLTNMASRVCLNIKPFNSFLSSLVKRKENSLRIESPFFVFKSHEVFIILGGLVSTSKKQVSPSLFLNRNFTVYSFTSISLNRDRGTPSDIDSAFIEIFSNKPHLNNPVSVFIPVESSPIKPIGLQYINQSDLTLSLRRVCYHANLGFLHSFNNRFLAFLEKINDCLVDYFTQFSIGLGWIIFCYILSKVLIHLVIYEDRKFSQPISQGKINP